MASSCEVRSFFVEAASRVLSEDCFFSTCRRALAVCAVVRTAPKASSTRSPRDSASDRRRDSSASWRLFCSASHLAVESRKEGQLIIFSISAWTCSKGLRSRAAASSFFFGGAGGREPFVRLISSCSLYMCRKARTISACSGSRLFTSSSLSSSTWRIAGCWSFGIVSNIPSDMSRTSSCGGAAGAGGGEARDGASLTFARSVDAVPALASSSASNFSHFW
mmetsp:Transcript_31439/g.105849  ORF Transcript_31439/g.105849 Transcript_31439/m.105849 type:complete len:221 (-) Transcript_31439:85-747(-)